MKTKKQAKKKGLPPFPMQPIVKVEGRLRFRENKVVEMLRVMCGSSFDLNKIGAAVDKGLLPIEDFIQFYQLIGYSLDGFAELSFVPDEIKDQADQLARDSGYET